MPHPLLWVSLSVAFVLFVGRPADDAPTRVEIETQTHSFVLDYQETSGARRLATVRVERIRRGRVPWRGALDGAAVLPADGGPWIRIGSLRRMNGGYIGSARVPGPGDIGAIAVRTERGRTYVWDDGTTAASEEEPPSEDPPKEDPPKEDPPEEDPPEEDPPEEDPPEEDPPEEDPPEEDPEDEGPCPEMRDPWTGECIGGDMKDPWGDITTQGTTTTIRL